jgi:hypothetical protein
MWSLLPQASRQVAVRWLVMLAARRLAERPEADPGAVVARAGSEKP